jgi:hypothetical protein
MGDADWDPWDPTKQHVSSAPAGVLLQLVITRQDRSVCTVVTDSSFASMSADDYYNPINNQVAWYNQVVENTDARAEPVDWKTDLELHTHTNTPIDTYTAIAAAAATATATDTLARTVDRDTTKNWLPAAAVQEIGFTQLQPKMARPVQSFAVGTKPLTVPPLLAPSPPNPTLMKCGVQQSIAGAPKTHLTVGCAWCSFCDGNLRLILLL